MVMPPLPHSDQALQITDSSDLSWLLVFFFFQLFLDTTTLTRFLTTVKRVVGFFSFFTPSFFGNAETTVLVMKEGLETPTVCAGAHRVQLTVWTRKEAPQGSVTFWQWAPSSRLFWAKGWKHYRWISFHHFYFYCYSTKAKKWEDSNTASKGLKSHSWHTSQICIYTRHCWVKPAFPHLFLLERAPEAAFQRWPTQPMSKDTRCGLYFYCHCNK